MIKLFRPARRHRLAGLLATTSLIAVGVAPMVSSALADGGNGGGVPVASGVTGGAGGTGFTGAPGGNGGTDGANTAGGGGGAAGGGHGGSGGAATAHGGPSAVDGNGGTALSPDGQAGGDGSIAGGGGGGGGGFNGNGAGTAAITNTVPLIGGNGGHGGTGIGNGFFGAGGGGGGGGGGGYGAIVTGSGANSNASTISGGAGGAGGAGVGGAAVSGNGGDGGVGVQFTASGATFTNTGTVRGGNGGAGGTDMFGAANGVAGAGGAGIVGAGLTIINGGTIAGGLANAGAGARANAITFTGGGNVLELQAGSSITGNVVGTGSDTFRLGGSTSSSFDVSTLGALAQYQGFSTFVKTGGSTWTLTGTNTAALPWSVNAGTLMVNGTLANSTFAVNAGGTLAGIGTVGNVTVATGGAFAPGSGAPGSTMAVSGSLAFQSGAFYLVQLNPAASSFASVTGTATLSGATVNAIFASGSYVVKQYTILNAGSISGTFNSTVANTNLPSGFQTTLSYDATHAFLNLVLGFTPPSGQLNTNQQNVGNTLTSFFNTSGSIPMVFGSLTPSGLTQISGETATGSQQTTFDAMGQFMGLLTDPFMSRTGGANPSPGAAGFAAEEQGVGAYAAPNNGDAYAMFTKAPPAPFVQRWSVWAAGFGGSQSTDGNAAVGSNNTTSNIAGTAVGADYLFSPNTLAGFALAGGGTNFSVAGGGSGRSDLFQAGAYLRHTDGPAYLSAALAYGWQDITTDRTVTVAGFDHLRAEFNANAWSGRIEGGYRFVAPVIGGIGITPYAAAQFVTFDLPAYAEQALTGASAVALNYAAKDVTDTRSELGIRSDKSFAMQDGILTLRGRLAWAHDFDPNRSIAATFQSLPGASFVVNGAAQTSDSALTTASIERKWINGWSAAATFEGEFSEVTRSYAGKGVVRYSW